MDRNKEILDHYGGSTLLSFLCDLTTLSIDQVNFISCQLFALLLSYIMKKWIRNPLTRLWYTLVSGITICIFCFGTQIFHIIISAGLSYLVIRNTKSRMMPWIVLVASMCYLSFLHIKRQFFDYTGGYSLDITGPMMVLTQKVTSLAFSIRDELDQKKEDDKTQTLTDLQRRYVVVEIPDELKYCSYIFQFQSMLAGPLVFYRDFIDFIDISGDDPPSPLFVVAQKIVYSVFFAVLFIKVGPSFDCQRVRDPGFLASSAVYQVFYLTVATTLERCKYFHAWILADAVCNMSGLGYDRTKGTWDLVSNVHAFAFELGPNLKESLDLWNIGTMKWLRHVVYERSPPNFRTGLVYMVSAFWHGFYPGYYVTFLSAALFTYAARSMRRNLRPFFLGGSRTKQAYDIGTWFTTRVVLGYVTFSFVVQDFIPTMNVYMNWYFFLHIITVVAMLIVPSLSRRFKNLKPAQALPSTSEKVGVSHPKSNGNGTIGNATVLKNGPEVSSQPNIFSQAIHGPSSVKSILSVADSVLPAKPILVASQPVPEPEQAFSTEESQNSANEEIWRNFVITSSAVSNISTSMSVKLKTG